MYVSRSLARRLAQLSTLVLRAISKVIKDVKEQYNIGRFTFWLTTYDGADVYAIDEGGITVRPVESSWKSEGNIEIRSPLVA